MALNERNVAGDAGRQIMQRYVARQRIGHRGRRHVRDLRVRHKHHTVIDAATLLVAQRELGGFRGTDTAGGLIHQGCIRLVAAGAAAEGRVSGRGKAHASDERDHNHAVAQGGHPSRSRTFHSKR